METVKDFILLGSKITADDDCSHGIKMFAPQKKSYDRPRQHIIKNRDVTLPTKVRIVKAMVFPVVMYWCESWAIENTECQRTDAFELWCWRRLLRIPWAGRRSNQYILKEISLEYSLEGLRLKPKLQYCGHLMWRANSLQQTLMLGKSAGKRRKRWQRMTWLDGITDSWIGIWASFRRWWRTGKPGMLQSMVLQRVRCDWATE